MSLEDALEQTLAKLLAPRLEKLDAALARLEAATPAEYLTTAQAAKVAGVSVRTVKTWLAEKRLQDHGQGRAVRVKRAELDALMAARKDSRPDSPPGDADALADQLLARAKNRKG